MAQGLFAQKRIVIMGLGLNGGGLLSAEFCLLQGADVLVTDLSDLEKLRPSISALHSFARDAPKLFPGESGEKHLEKHLEFRLGSHVLGDFQQADLVIKNPGVPADSPYLKAAKAWTTDLALFLELYPQVPVLAVTGTKGKSSIAHALHYILQHYYPDAMLGGNIGYSPLAYALESSYSQGSVAGKGMAPKSPVTRDWGQSPLVLELSSWQLHDLHAVQHARGKALLQPQVACLSNIMCDHQNRYQRFYDYVVDKFSIFEHMTEGDLLLPTACSHPGSPQFLGCQFWGDFAARQYGRVPHYFCTTGSLPGTLSQGLSWEKDGTCRLRSVPETQQLNGVKIEAQVPFLPAMPPRDNAFWGRHSWQNYGLAGYMAYLFLNRRALRGDVAAQNGLERFYREGGNLARSYKGIPFRMELRGTQVLASGRQVSFINDTTATMPDATAAAIETCLDKKEVRLGHCLLLLGGADKDLDPSVLLSALRSKYFQVSLFLLSGSGTDRLLPALSGIFYRAGKNGKGFNSLPEAFTAAVGHIAGLEAQEIDRDGDQKYYLLLSPGYASFGMFRNEFDRGGQFNQLVQDYLESL